MTRAEQILKMVEGVGDTYRQLMQKHHGELSQRNLKRVNKAQAKSKLSKAKQIYHSDRERG